MTRLSVVQPGPLTLVQDRGRPGLAHLGLARLVPWTAPHTH